MSDAPYIRWMIRRDMPDVLLAWDVMLTNQSRNGQRADVARWGRDNGHERAAE